MINRWKQEFKRRFLDWLCAQIDERNGSQIDAAVRQHLEREKQNRIARYRQAGLIHESAQLSPEAAIENKCGRRAGVAIGAHSYLRGRLLTYGHGGNIEIGDWCYIGVRTEIWSMNSIKIGNRVLISHDVNIHDGNAHSIDAAERHEHFKHILERGHPREERLVPGLKSAPIVIEDDAWISFGVTILKGVTVGKGSVIAAGSIVTKDVPPGVLYQCKVVPIIRPLEGVKSMSELNFAIPEAVFRE
ncbi:MAG TPA: acyltransferase [Candidatus Obscuribacterales bacterium]